MARHKLSGPVALVAGVLALAGIAFGGQVATQAKAVDGPGTGTQAALQGQPDKLRDMPEYMKTNHGLYDNALTALYEQWLAGEVPSSSVSAGSFDRISSAFAPLYGPDVRMSNPAFQGSQNEFQIDINPTNHAAAIGSSNDGRIAGVGLYRTTDGGATWVAADANAFGVPAACCDPGIAYGSNGTAYAIILDTSPAVTYIIRSTDNGVTWGGMTQVNTPDRPNIATDPSNPNIVYITYTDFNQPAGRIAGYKSTDGGATWGSSFLIGDPISSPGYQQSSQPRVASNGWVYVGYQEYNDQNAGCAAGVRNEVARSTDAGATWAVTELNIVQGGACTSSQAGRGVFCINSSNSSFRSRSHPIMSVNPTNPSHVYMVYSGGDLETAYTCGTATGFHGDTLFRKSTDAGVTWSSPVRINNDPVGKDQYYPWVDVAADGTIWAGWNDRRDDANNYRSIWYQAHSTDEGATWLNANNQPGNDQVADVSTLPSTFIGDYHGLAAENDKVLGMWYDSRIVASGDPYTDPHNPGGPQQTPTPLPTNTPVGPTATITPTPGCTPGPAGWTNGPVHPASPGIIRAVGVYSQPLGKFYTIGGRTSDSAGSDTTNPYEYNPATNSWATKSWTYPDNLVNNMACAMLTVSGTPYIYCVGGSAAGGTVYTPRVFRYNPYADTGNVVAGDEWPGNPNSNILPGGFAVYNNKMYIIGGFLQNTNMVASVWEYDPNASGSHWTQKADMPYPLGYVPAATIGNYIYTAGGSDWDGTTLVDSDKAFRYDPATNTWDDAAIADLPQYTAETRALNVGGKLWVMGGGRTAPNPSNVVQAWDPATNTWSTPTSFVEARRNFPVDTDGSYIWLAGGYAPSSATNTMEIYHPAITCETPTPVPPTGTATSTPPAATETPVPPTPCTITFSDVPPENTFYPYVRCLACRGVLGGYSDGTYRPNNNITRGQIAKVVSNAAAFNDPIPQDRQTYTDVPNTQTFWEWIERLTIHGVMSGYNCGGPGEPCDPQNRAYFRPYNNATRAQLAKIDSNAAGFSDDPTGQTFTDVPSTHPFYVWIERLAERGIMGGYQCGIDPNEPCDPQNRPYFRPYNNVTRGQAAKIVANTFYPNCQTPR